MKYLFLIIPLFLLSGSISAQKTDLKVLASSGGESNVDGMQLTWTMGEIFTDYETTNEYRLQGGFHQGFQVIPTATGIPADFGISVFPNPLKGILKVNLTNVDSQKPWKIEVYNNLGILLNQQTSTSEITEVDFSALPPSSYLLKISNNAGSYQVYKIIKE